MKLLLDTHVWLWSISQPARIPASVRKTLESAPDQRWLSSVSVWEAMLLLERRRIDFALDAPGVIREALRISRVLEAPLTHDIAIESRRLLTMHEDPADRFLVATARVMNLTLVTADQKIINGGACRTLPC